MENTGVSFYIWLIIGIFVFIAMLAFVIAHPFITFFMILVALIFAGHAGGGFPWR